MLARTFCETAILWMARSSTSSWMEPNKVPMCRRVRLWVIENYLTFASIESYSYVTLFHFEISKGARCGIEIYQKRPMAHHTHTQWAHKYSDSSSVTYFSVRHILCARRRILTTEKWLASISMPNTCSKPFPCRVSWINSLRYLLRKCAGDCEHLYDVYCCQPMRSWPWNGKKVDPYLILKHFSL